MLIPYDVILPLLSLGQIRPSLMTLSCLAIAIIHSLERQIPSLSRWNEDRGDK